MANWKQYDVGVGNVGSYQVAGHPYLTGSELHKGREIKIEFPFISIEKDQVLSARIGLQSILILFILGAFVLSKVNISEGEKIAKEYL